MTLASDLLLVSGPTWVDDLADTCHSLSMTAERKFALDNGELLHFDSVADIPCAAYVKLAIRPWGRFVMLNHEFCKANFIGTDKELLALLAENLTRANCVEALKDLLALTEFDLRTFQSIGITTNSDVLRSAGWKQLSELEQHTIESQYHLEFRPRIVLEQAFPLATAQNRIRTIDTSAAHRLFQTNRKEFWTLENDARGLVCDALDYYGKRCNHIFVFQVHHDSFVFERPETGWKNVADVAWPIGVLLCFDHALIYAPGVQEGLVLDETRRTAMACWPVMSRKLSTWAQHRHIPTKT
jgi:hypothetical protein